MGLYDVVAPCAYLVDGHTVHHTRKAVAVEVDDAQAPALVEAGQLVPHELGKLGIPGGTGDLIDGVIGDGENEEAPPADGDGDEPGDGEHPRRRVRGSQ